MKESKKDKNADTLCWLQLFVYKAANTQPEQHHYCTHDYLLHVLFAFPFTAAAFFSFFAAEKWVKITEVGH